VRTIAQAHGGDAGVADLPEGGADVWIAIPAAERAATVERHPLGV
jgi:signal transduction histidine kinase